MRQLIVFLAVVILVNSTAAATTYYVSPTGSNSADGLTEETAWLSLDNGNERGIMAPGDTVLILPGTYDISSEYHLTQPGTGDQPIVYRRLGKGEVRIDAKNSADVVILVEADHIELHGLHLLNAKDDGLHVQADSCYVSSFYIGAPGRRGIRTEGNYNFFYRNVIAFAGEDGIKNEDAGKFGNKYYHNTIYQSTNHGIEIKGAVAECRVFNCIIVESGDKGITGPVGAVCAYNNIWGSLNGDYSGVVDSAGGISSPPRFVDPASERFDLKASADEIDAGIDLGYDFNRTAPDIGAFEKYNTYFVSNSGSDENDGSSPATAWQTIDNGDSLLYPGDTVYISTGTYADSVIFTDSGLVDDPIVYSGIRDSSILRGAWHQAVRIRGQYLTIAGLSVYGAAGAGFYVTGGNNQLYECRTDSCLQYGVHLVSGTNNSVVRSVLAGSGTAGMLAVADSLNVWHCTFVKNSDFDIDASGINGLSVRNNVFRAGVSPLAAIRATSSASTRYCEFFSYSTRIIGGGTLGTGCFSANPQFLDPNNGIYRLDATSPAIDAGENIGVRYAGPAPDLGAYETGVPISISISPAMDSMLADNQYQFSAEAIDSIGHPTKTGPLLWSHTFSTGSISSSGLFVPELTDTGTISVEAVTYGLAATTASIRVVPGSLSTLSISPSRDTVSADSTRQFSYSGYDSKGNPVSDVGNLSWSVLNGIGTVDGDGLFTATRAGKGFVRANSDYGISGTSDTITVIPGDITSVDVQPSVNIIVQGNTHQYSVLGYDADSNIVEDLSASATWSTTDTSGNIDASGLYTAGTIPSPPVYRIKAEWSGLSDSGEVSVISNGVLSYIRIEYADGTPVTDTSTTTDNDTTRVYARGYDSGDILLGEVSCAWQIIGADSIGWLSSASGISTTLQLVGPGTGKIVAEYAVDVVDTSGIITSEPGAASRIQVFPDSAMSVNADSMLTFTCRAYDADGNVTDPPTPYAWDVIGGIGSVNAAGQFSPETAGAGFVYAASGVMTDTSKTITVTPGALARIHVTPDTAIVSADSTLTYTATGFDAEDNQRDPGVITWQLTESVGSIGASGLFDAVTAGTARVIATSNLGPVDTSAILEVLPGDLNSIVIVPDSLEISADSTATFTASGFDADGNSVSISDINWSSVNGLSDIDGSGQLDPHTVGLDRIVGRSVVGSDTIADTSTAVVITPGVLNRLSISPNTATLGIGDSLQFFATGYDQDFNATDIGTLEWSVSGGLGTIDSTGLLIADASGTGQVRATNVGAGVSAATNTITVEALRIASVALGDKTVTPGIPNAVLFKCQLINAFGRSIAINSLAMNSSFTGSGDASELLTNVDSLRLYIDVDNDSEVDPGDSLVSTTPMDAGRVVFLFDSASVSANSSVSVLVAADVSLFARDADSIDLYLLPGLDVETTDGTVVQADDSLNSQGVAVVDGMITDQITLTPRPSDSVRSGDSLVYLASLDIPRNGYENDFLEIISITNAGTATESDIDSLVLFADNGNGSWDGVSTELRVAKLVYTGSHWTRSGLSVPLTGQSSRFYLAARFADYGQNRASVRLDLPQNGISVSSGNDGPIDADLLAIDSLIILTDHQLEIQSLTLPSRTLVPGTNSGPLFGLNLVNGTQSSVTIQQFALDFVGYDPEGASQAELDSQIDSVSLYRAGDTDYGAIGTNDVLLGSAQITDGRVTFDSPGITIAGGGSDATLLAVCWLSGTEAKNGNSIGFSLTNPEDITVNLGVDISASFPLLNPNQHVIDAFPASHIAFTAIGDNAIFGGESDRTALVFHVPANGYSSDTLSALQVTNLGTVNDEVITRLSLYADADPPGVGPEDTVLSVMTRLANVWKASNLDYPVSQAGANLYVNVDISSESFEGGTLRLAIPEAGVVYNSGMVGPDGSSSSPEEDILIFPPNRVTAVSIPLATTHVFPGSQDNGLLTFALYNGYVEQSRHLSRTTLTNTSRVASDDQWADQSVGQVRLYYDQNRNRIYDDDLLIGSGFFEDRKFTFSGMNVALPPESLSYFFVVADCPLAVTDSDSLSAAINGAADLAFAEPVSLNGDIPLTRGGYVVINGSVRPQYAILPLSSRSISPNDSNVVLLAFNPAINGDRADTLVGATINNALDADESDIQNLELWSDTNSDQEWQPSDVLLGSFSYVGGSWIASAFQYVVDTLSHPLIVTAVVSDSARSGRAFRGYLPVNACQYSSGNDGPVDGPAMGNATFTISSSALRLEYDSMRTTYSVGEPITLATEATNRLGSDLDSVYSYMQVGGDQAAVVQDSASSGPMYIASDGAAMFQHYFTASQPGMVVFQSRAIATTINDSSAVIESDSIRVQDIPSALKLSMQNFMPTAVARGQKNVFPLSLTLSHGDTLAAAAIEVKSITISVMDGSGSPQPASFVFSRLLLADDDSPVAVLSSFSDSADIRVNVVPPIKLQPADTAELVLLMDISDSAQATSLVLGIETIDAIEAVDENTDMGVSLSPGGSVPLRTASCRIDDPSQTLAVSNSSPALAGVNVGQQEVAVLGLGLRHPGISGMSQIQVVELSLAAVSGIDTVVCSSVADRISVYRSTEFLGEASGSDLENDLVSIGLGSGLTINPDSRDSLTVKVSVAPDIVMGTFQIVISDSSAIEIRDGVSGSEVAAVTDREVLATGSVFPLTSSTVTVYRPTESLKYCITNPLPASVVAGTHGVALVGLDLEHEMTSSYSPVRVSEVSLLVLDSSGAPLDPGRLFDRTGYRLGLGSEQYHATVSLRNGATVFPLSDTGVVLMPTSQFDIELIADIESDCPYDNFQLILADVSTISLSDAIDSTRIPNFIAATSCDTTIPYQSAVARVFKPAGAPRLISEHGDTRIAFPGQTDLPVGGFEFGYSGSLERGDIEFTSMQLVLYQRNGGSMSPIPVAEIFSRLWIEHNGVVIAEDTLVSADTCTLSVDPSLILSHGYTEDIFIAGDIRSNVSPGNYRITIEDSASLAMRDRNLGTSVYPALVSGSFPITLANISISVQDLSASFSNYPNPFMAQEGPTTIAYVLPEDADVDIEVFSITGEPVARIASNERRGAGPHQDQTWDGLNDAGLKVVPGTYFCRITARYDSGRTETARRKVAVIR